MAILRKIVKKLIDKILHKTVRYTKIDYEKISKKTAKVWLLAIRKVMDKIIMYNIITKFRDKEEFLGIIWANMVDNIKVAAEI